MKTCRANKKKCMEPQPYTSKHALSCLLSQSIGHSLAQSASHSFKPLTHWFARLLTHSFARSLTHSLTPLTHSLPRSLTHSLTHSLTAIMQLANIYRYWYTRPFTISLLGFENSLMCIMHLLMWLM